MKSVTVNCSESVAYRYEEKCLFMNMYFFSMRAINEYDKMGLRWNDMINNSIKLPL